MDFVSQARLMSLLSESQQHVLLSDNKLEVGSADFSKWGSRYINIITIVCSRFLERNANFKVNVFYKKITFKHCKFTQHGL